MRVPTQQRATEGSDRALLPRPSWWEVCALAIGALLMTVQFLSRRSLWVDEIAVVHNLAARSLGELLTQPLDYDQVAPALFLLVQKGMYSLLGGGELSMRAYPYAMALLALVLTWALGRRLLDGALASLPPLLLGLSAQHIWLSSQVKQYSGDVAMTAALLLVALTAPDGVASARWRRGALAAGLVAPWISQPSLFSLAAAGLALVVTDWDRTQRLSRSTLVLIAAWGVSGVGALLSAKARVSAGTMQFMREFWVSGFLPFPPSTWNELKWPAYTLRILIAEVTDARWSYAYFFVALVGVLVLWRRSRVAAMAFVVPVAGAMAASAVGQYPLEGRLGFFLAPIAVVLVSVGIAALVHAAPAPRWGVASMALLLTVPPVATTMQHLPPYTLQHTRPLFERLRAEVRPGDRVYIPYGGWQAWWYYAPRLGLAGVPAIVGTCHHTDLGAYASEVRQLQGAGRGWILFVPAGELQWPDEILRVADTLGDRAAMFTERQRDAEGREREVGLWRYDLRAPAQSEAPPPMGALPAGCRGAAVDRLLPRP